MRLAAGRTEDDRHDVIRPAGGQSGRRQVAAGLIDADLDEVARTGERPVGRPERATERLRGAWDQVAGGARIRVSERRRQDREQNECDDQCRRRRAPRGSREHGFCYGNSYGGSRHWTRIPHPVRRCKSEKVKIPSEAHGIAAAAAPQANASPVRAPRWPPMHTGLSRNPTVVGSLGQRATTLRLLFAFGMSVGPGIKSALNASVFSAAAASIRVGSPGAKSLQHG